VPEEILNFSRHKPPVANPVAGLPPWEAAAERIRRAISRGEGILVFGDYDCDGACSVAPMLDFLSSAGAPAQRLAGFIPNRFDHEYGLTEAGLASAQRASRALKAKVGLVIAVDCGSNSLEEIRMLKRERNIDTVILDHHLV
jgi:single-stranded-DNA-specific exonuclease